MSFQRFAKDRLRREQWDAVDWQDIVAAFQGATPEQRQKFVEAVRSRRFEAIARSMMKIISGHVEAAVDTEYDQMVADGSLSQQEINRLFR